MATVTKKRVKREASFGDVPYGNATKKHFTFETNSSGVYEDSDKAAAVASGDKVRIGYLEKGTKIYDAKALVSDAFTGSATGKIGFEYADGVDDSSAPQDDDYFFAALALDALSRTAANNTGVRPVVLAKDAYVILTVGGANLAAVGKLDLVIEVELKGAN
jgi:hypothetical protein